MEEPRSRGDLPTQQPPAPFSFEDVEPPREKIIRLRLRELTRLEQLVDLEPAARARDFTTAWITAAGIALTTLLPLAGYYSTHPRPPIWVSVVAWVLFGLSIGVTIASAAAAHYFKAGTASYAEMLKTQIRELDYSRVSDEQTNDPGEIDIQVGQGGERVPRGTSSGINTH